MNPTVAYIVATDKDWLGLAIGLGMANARVRARPQRGGRHATTFFCRTRARCPGQLLRTRSGGTPSRVTQFMVVMNKLDAKRDAAVDLLGILGFLGLLHPLECASSAWGSYTSGRRAPRWPGA